MKEMSLGSPKSLDYFEVKSMLKDIPGVMMVHNLHIWSLNVDKHCLTAHLAIGKTMYFTLIFCYFWFGRVALFPSVHVLLLTMRRHLGLFG